MSKFVKRSYMTDSPIMLTPKWEALTGTVPQALGVDDGQGNKIVQAGTPIPANDDTMFGLLAYDTDVTHGDVGTALVRRGNVNLTALADRGITLTAAAMEAVPTLAFITPDIET